MSSVSLSMGEFCVGSSAVALGPAFRTVPKWSAIASMASGLSNGFATHYLPGLDTGSQVFLVFAMMSAVLVTSPPTGKRHTALKPALAAALILTATLFFLVRLFASETKKERTMREAFFKELDTPADVLKKVHAAGRRQQVSTMSLAGRTIMFMGILVSAWFLTGLPLREAVATAAMMIFLIGFGSMLWIPGKRAERGSEKTRYSYPGSIGSACILAAYRTAAGPVDSRCRNLYFALRSTETSVPHAHSDQIRPTPAAVPLRHCGLCCPGAGAAE